MKRKSVVPQRRFFVRLSIDEGLNETVYAVFLPVLPGCASLTKTIDDAKQMLLEAIANDYVVVYDADSS